LEVPSARNREDIVRTNFAFDSLKKFKPKNIFDMSLVTAAIRPSGASYRDDLLARKIHHNPSKIIDDMLKDNLGYIIYQCDTIRFLQEVCGLSGSAADNIRRGIARKKKEILDAAMPAILDGYCNKSDKPRKEAEGEAKEFLQVIEDSASYQFGYNHSIAYCLLGYLCAYYRYYHPLEFITAFLNNAANDEDVYRGTLLANQKGIRITAPKYGISKSDYEFDRDTNIIAKGLSSVKYMSAGVAKEIYKLSQTRKYDYFVDLLCDLNGNTSLKSNQLDLLIRIDFFSEFGNQPLLLKLNSVFERFKKGKAKMIKKDRIDGTIFEEAVLKYSTGTTKGGGESKSYTLLDVREIMRLCEEAVKKRDDNLDADVTTKARNFKEIMGYAGYVSGKEEDRRKLLIKEIYPVRRKRDNVLFGYSLITQSIGSGKESRMTVFKTRFDLDPLQEDDIILCKSWEKQGKYFRLVNYEKIL
jgi:DNA polymerase III subunit alpha